MLDSKPQLEFLYMALGDAQGTIRFTDTKAGVIIIASGVLVPYIMPLGKAILDHSRLLITPYAISTILIGVIGFFSFLMSLLIAFKAINPMSSPVKHIVADNVTTNIPFYLYDIAPSPSFLDWLYERKTSNLKHSAKTYFHNLKKDTISDELLKSLVLEVCKVSYIREKKIFRVNKAFTLFALGLIFLFIFSIMAHSIQWI